MMIFIITLMRAEKILHPKEHRVNDYSFPTVGSLKVPQAAVDLIRTMIEILATKINTNY